MLVQMKYFFYSIIMKKSGHPPLHTPVLINQVLQFLSPKNDEHHIDATFGAGGYTKAILDLSNCNVVAVDRDENVNGIAQTFKKIFAEKFNFYNLDFGHLSEIKNLHPAVNVYDGIVFDIGVSSMQLDQPERGFSFRSNGPLDMRMDPTWPVTAATVVNSYDERRIADLLYNYGGERKSFQIAKAIVHARGIEKITTTKQLAKIVQSCVGSYNDQINPATRTFQAIRMEVNEELPQLEMGLKQAVELLKVGGRLLVVTFHSGEDKIVKDFFNKLCGKVESINRHMPSANLNAELPSFSPLFKGVLKADAKELKSNPRSRSAKLRGVLKIR